MASGSSHRRVEVARIPDSDLLPLLDILKYFNNPINEEQAWAVCYQCAQFYLREQSQQKYQELYEYGLQCVCLDRDGEIQIRVRAGDPNGSGKGPPKGQYYAIRKWHATEHDAVQMLGRIIFEALDYGIGEAEERPLSHGLETLIECMTRAQESGENTDNESQSADDEGIEKDAEDDHHCSFREVARLCTQHLSSRQDASYHYRAVCRALMAEAVELRTFLDKISSSKERLHSNEDEDKRLLELERTDWARLWVQVMRSLRQGVRLKKNEHVSHPPVEYELTPFEMLLEDIRSRRYTLHKIMVNGDIPPKVKNDAHAVILDFIRSRPPLRQVKDRKLRSLPPKPPDPHEQLLLDIRAKPKLRPVKDGRLVVYEDSLIADLFILETSRTKLGGEDSPPVTRRVIKPDFSLFLTSSFEESEEDSEVESPERTPQHRRELWKLSPLNSPAKDMNATWHSDKSLEEEEEEGEGTSSETDLALLTASEMMHMRYQGNNTTRKVKRWQNPIECLSLTLEEVTHIRSVLTKAELESLISHPDLYHQVSKSKVCFTCKTTRFTLFGEWGTKCKFCKRTVCSKCMRKMHVPTEHFKNIPVYTLQSHAIYQRSSGADTELRQNKFLNRCLIQRPNILQAHQNLCAGSTEGKATSSALPVSEPSEQKCFCKCPEHCSR
ncbi:protein spire homolog 1-like isoform X14 [Pomacea canaliculata]|uniref:protein spire homolog 1-like isoform X14 n=1 Tax=Pomacea canaliculata TaxID=400727 RepID=UPI000D72BCAF|nr:protein spire homolog 1-like isoform X14 [Pomacea canaliculata]